MKLIPLFLCLGSALLAQPLSFGIKGGVPMTDFLDTVSSSRITVNSTTNRYIVGPTVELRLPLSFAVEVDALYRHFRYNSAASVVDAVTSINTSGSAWEFPLLLKKRLLHGPIRPFVDAGVSFNKISGLTQTVRGAVFPGGSPPALRDDFTSGFTIGGGVELKALLIKISPEIRYTRWSTQHFNTATSGGSVRSNLNQAEFLVGITW